MRKIIYLIAVLCCLCANVDSHCKTVNRDIAKSIIQFQDSIIKNSVTYSYVYGDSQCRFWGLRGVVWYGGY